MERSNFLTYQSGDGSIQIQYPSDWRCTNGISGNLATQFAPAFGYKNIVPEPLTLENIDELRKKTELWLSTYSTNFSIWIFSSMNKDLALYTHEKIDELKRTLPGFRLIESSPCTLGGNIGHRIVYSYLESGSRGTMALNVWTIKGDKAYEIIYKADPEKYKDCYDIAEMMICSFDIIDI